MKKIIIINLIFLLNINLWSFNYTDNSYRDNMDYITVWTTWTQVAFNIASVCLISMNFVASQCFWKKSNLRTSRRLARCIRDLNNENQKLEEEIIEAEKLLSKLKKSCKRVNDNNDE